MVTTRSGATTAIDHLCHDFLRARVDPIADLARRVDAFVRRGRYVIVKRTNPWSEAPHITHLEIECCAKLHAPTPDRNTYHSCANKQVLIEAYCMNLCYQDTPTERADAAAFYRALNRLGVYLEDDDPCGETLTLCVWPPGTEGV